MDATSTTSSIGNSDCNSKKERSPKKKSGRQKSAKKMDEPHRQTGTSQLHVVNEKEDGHNHDESPTRTPVMVPMSPGSSLHMSGPLQGSARVIKDHCADWHNYMQKWDSLNDKGFAVANKTINLILQSREKEAAEVAAMKTGSTETSQEIVGGSTMPDELEELCNEFTEIHNAMVKLVDKMVAITKHFKGICELEMQTSSSSVGKTAVLFKTWPVEYFYESSVVLQDMYSKELDVKRIIVQDIAHNANRDILMTYISAWQHQPFIEDHATTLLESMLHETGHR